MAPKVGRLVGPCRWVTLRPAKSINQITTTQPQRAGRPFLALTQQQRAEDVLLLAKAYYQGRDYRRAFHTLERHGLLGFKVRGAL